MTVPRISVTTRVASWYDELHALYKIGIGVAALMPLLAWLGGIATAPLKAITAQHAQLLIGQESTLTYLRRQESHDKERTELIRCHLVAVLDRAAAYHQCGRFLVDPVVAEDTGIDP